MFGGGGGGGRPPQRAALFQLSSATVIPTVSRFAAFECLKTLADCSQGRETALWVWVCWGGLNLCLSFICPSVPGGAWHNKAGGRGEGQKQPPPRSHTSPTVGEFASAADPRLQVHQDRRRTHVDPRRRHQRTAGRLQSAAAREARPLWRTLGLTCLLDDLAQMDGGIKQAPNHKIQPHDHTTALVYWGGCVIR